MESDNSDFRKNLVNFVISRIEGSNDLDQTVKSRPSKKFILGSLATLKPINDEIIKEDILDNKASIRANRLRTSILVKNLELQNQHKISIVASGYIFYKIHSNEVNDEADVEKDGENSSSNTNKRKYTWKRRTFEIPIEVNVFPNQSEYIKNVNFSSVVSACNLDQDNFIIIPPDTWKAEVQVIIKTYGKDSSIIHFYLSNTNIENENEYNLEKTLFKCKLRIDLGDIRTIEFIDEYKYNDHKQKYFYDFRTINCQAKYINKPNNSIIETDNHYLFEQKEIKTISNDNLYDLSFKSLSESDWLLKLEAILPRMQSLIDNYNSYIAEDENIFMPRQGNRQVEAGELISALSNFHELMRTYKHGLESLKFNDKARIAFTSMNKVFYNYYKNKLGNNYNIEEQPSWRVFQIVFIVSSIRSIVDETDRDIVDVLHVATGGGKSEAYFGLIIFGIFYERLIGKGDGVTAIVKFPLRMLSIQQLQRLSGIIIYAEQLRKEQYELFKGTEFSLGYYVGNSDDFPSLYYDVRKELYDDLKLTKLKKQPTYSKIISYCPLCDYGERGKVVIKDQPEEKRLLHQCSLNHDHFFHIYYSDREIFRYRPSVIVSTVDKWAGLSQQKRARALLGSNGSMCPDGHGFIPSGEQCENEEKEGICKNIGENISASPGPILSVQDEIHLLSESFGTIASHFEGLIEEIVSNNSNGSKIKNIAMSATLNGIQSQIRELYKKNVFVISGESSIVDNPAFDLFFRKEENTQRLIYGMVPNIRDNHYATLRTILHAIEFLYLEQKSFLDDPTTWIKKYNMESQNEAIQTFRDFQTMLTYHLKKQDAEDMDRFSPAVINEVLEKKFNITTKGKVLTGDRGIDELKNTIDRIEKNSKEYNIERQTSAKARYEPIFATSVVSHGLDIEQLNFMVFQGIPYTTSEYIQALSRVGRHREGIVIVWLYPNRVRDNSFFKNFGRYHESLDHEVLPAPIKRNSPLGAKQTVNSLFCAGIIQFLSNKHGKPLIHKDDIEQLNSQDKLELIEFIKSAYGGNINLNIESEVEERIDQICKANNNSRQFFPTILSDSGDYFYHNQVGMRGIQGQLKIIPTGNTRTMLKQIEGEN